MKTYKPWKLATAECPGIRRISRVLGGGRKAGKIMALMALLIFQVIRTVEAQGTTVVVDFSVLSIPTDITIENNPPGYAGLTLNGATMSYDNYGSASDFANANSAGIAGTTYGPLNFSFTAPATAMNFDFTVTGVPGPDPNALVASFSLAGSIVDTVTVPGTFGGGQINGSLAYTAGAGVTFDQATMFFTISNSAPPGYGFTTQNISYVSTVPEPGTSALWGLGAGWLLLIRRLHNRVRNGSC